MHLALPLEEEVHNSCGATTLVPAFLLNRSQGNEELVEGGGLQPLALRGCWGSHRLLGDTLPLLLALLAGGVLGMSMGDGTTLGRGNVQSRGVSPISD